MTKHEQIIAYIETLSIGSKISVRKIAKVLRVSEGTAYRAIKDASRLGLVATIDRVGTVRIEKKSRDRIEQLTYDEIVQIVNGKVLGGKGGLSKTLSQFAIGAMELKDVLKYLSQHTLLIVGNRREVQYNALKKGSAVLITGGFSTSKEIIQYANKHELPLISCNYDSYMAANLINRSLYNKKIRTEVLVVEDIAKSIDETCVLLENMTLRDYKERATATGHSRFPVIDDNWRLTGLVTSKEIINMGENDSVKLHMSTPPIYAQLHTTIASCAYMMIWEGIELLPVVSPSKKLVGVITREDVLKAMHVIGQQPHVGETINDQIAKHITLKNDKIKLLVSPLLTNQFGMLSKSVIVAIIEETIRYEFHKFKKLEVMIESLNIVYIKSLPIESDIEVSYDMLDIGRSFAKVEVTMHSNNERVVSAMIMCQLLD
ncbi:DRTGG domain-containing protein [Staphylococcus sp. SQ8-PEA]|uniref:DRTGG domain-containing protein n=1 Tax=Staphylococcus marylandisciuri TaxID=2981529 RepID=A0ABT2QQ76_9STAP|nr:DRTGG domain-containing protein [Staphylococcus marylandisciuri]MCU5746105.1 DRTGG domain-containing protein [Staphylococcus marylandisciuri]